MAWSAGKKLQSGRYTIERKLGEGGFGVTYLAKSQSGKRVVVKTVNEQVQNQPDFAKFQQDFLNEALRLAGCSHQHIVRVDEIIQEERLWCMVMEYIEGEDLATRLKKRGALSEPEALNYIQQIGEALTVVHNQGLLHRDVKPQNIMVRSGKFEAVLIDFGIAREFTPDVTQIHTTFLTDYFAPLEQYEEEAKRGAYTDIYALAATLYTLLTNQIPASAIARERSVLKQNTDLLESPKRIRATISVETDQAILNGMLLKAEDRPQTLQEWLKLLPNEFKNARDYYRCGLEEGKRGRYTEAIEHFNNAICINPEYAEAYKYRGIARSKTGSYSEALEDFIKASELYGKQGEVDDKNAVLEFIQSLNFKGFTDEDYYRCGLEEGKRGRYTEAIEHFNNAICINPNYAKAYRHRGIAKSRTGNYSEALEDFLRAAKLYGDQGEVNDQNEVLERIQNLNFIQSFAGSTNTSEASSMSEINYLELENLLAVGNWGEADKKTLSIMLKIAGRDYWLRRKDIEMFPSQDLLVIDHLWIKYSDGRFGFSVQKRIWQKVGGHLDADYCIREKFDTRVGWSTDDLVEYTFPPRFETLTLEKALPGQLPFLVTRGGDIARDWFLKYLLLHPALKSSNKKPLIQIPKFNFFK
ncbi:protein kinase domain-containing protein [Phormidesmis sp. 146-33]